MDRILDQKMTLIITPPVRQYHGPFGVLANLNAPPQICRIPLPQSTFCQMHRQIAPLGPSSKRIWNDPRDNRHLMGDEKQGQKDEKFNLTWLHIGRGREIHSVRPAGSLDILVGPCQANHFGVEICSWVRKLSLSAPQDCHVPAIYFFTSFTESRAGSQLMKTGKTASSPSPPCSLSNWLTTALILSSSSGQMSGQLVNPK